MINSKNENARREPGAKHYTHPKAIRSAGFNQGRFDKAALPAPVAILQRLGIKTSRANAKGYMQIVCPFHKGGEEKNASLSMHIVNGNFRCFACGAHGGDVLAFWMQYSGQSFKKAAQELGAWKGGAA